MQAYKYDEGRGQDGLRTCWTSNSRWLLLVFRDQSNEDDGERDGWWWIRLTIPSMLVPDCGLLAISEIITRYYHVFCRRAILLSILFHPRRLHQAALPRGHGVEHVLRRRVHHRN